MATPPPKKLATLPDTTLIAIITNLSSPISKPSTHSSFQVIRVLIIGRNSLRVDPPAYILTAHRGNLNKLILRDMRLDRCREDDARLCFIGSLSQIRDLKLDSFSFERCFGNGGNQRLNFKGTYSNAALVSCIRRDKISRSQVVWAWLQYGETLWRTSQTTFGKFFLGHIGLQLASVGLAESFMSGTMIPETERTAWVRTVTEQADSLAIDDSEARSKVGICNISSSLISKDRDFPGQAIKVGLASPENSRSRSWPNYVALTA
jgi:hypothetical protein